VIPSTESTFSFPEVSIGIPTIVEAIRLPQRVGWANAMELLLTGKPISAERAKEIGLVWRGGRAPRAKLLRVTMRHN
jgi:E-phenylitaconyl-CoA hydratase